MAFVDPLAQVFLDQLTAAGPPPDDLAARAVAAGEIDILLINLARLPATGIANDLTSPCWPDLRYAPGRSAGRPKPPELYLSRWITLMGQVRTP